MRADIVDTLHDGGTRIYGYFNNHYAGDAIGSVGVFREVWNGESGASLAEYGPTFPCPEFHEARSLRG